VGGRLLDAVQAGNKIVDVAQAGSKLAKESKAASRLVETAAESRKTREIVVDAAKHPESAKHIKDAQAAGKPEVLTIDRAGAKERRAQATRDTPTQPGKDRDEYPPAMTKEGGQGASVRPVSSADNRGAGACIGNQCRNMPDGTKIRIRVREP